MLKNISVFALGLVAAVSIGCGGATAPTNADINKNLTPETQKGADAAAKEAKGEELSTDEEAATASPAGNKGAGAPRRAAPAGTPNQ